MSDAAIADGAFGARFSRRRGTKIDEPLARVIRCLISAARGHNHDMTTTAADIGAGAGGYVLMASQEPGVLAVGVDGTPGIVDVSAGFVREANLAEPQANDWVARLWKDRFDAVDRSTLDVAWFVEVGEHIPEPKESTVLDNLARARPSLMLVSWATPGQRGRGHVNCRSPEYVANRLGERRFVLNESLTRMSRDDAGRGWDRKLLVFSYQ